MTIYISSAATIMDVRTGWLFRPCCYYWRWCDNDCYDGRRHQVHHF